MQKDFVSESLQPLRMIPDCTYLFQPPSIKEFIVFAGPPSKPEHRSRLATLAGKFNERKP